MPTRISPSIRGLPLRPELKQRKRLVEVERSAQRLQVEAELNYRIEPGEPYFHDRRERWSAALRAAHNNIPRPPYGNASQ